MIKLIPEPSYINIINNEKHKIDHITLGENALSSAAKNDFLSFCKRPQGEANIIFKTDNSLDHEEYIIKTDEKIIIDASGAAGQLYALQTLKQLLFAYNFNIPCIEIKDKPKYKIRGFMLDVGRYFYSVDDVKLIIRKMAAHKLNFFHFHLTEDQGWRIEIKKYPLLTEKGAMRTKTNFNNKPHGGFYTQQEIKEIVSYAHDFNIKIMPEYDIPGHSRSAIACYKDLTCFPRDLPVADHWGVKHDVLCVGKESTIQFVKDIIDEMCVLFPDEYFHIGGDEVPKHRWNLCPQCQAKIKKLGLKDSEDLQCWFMNTIKEYCKAKGKQVFMWSWDLKDEGSLDTDLGFSKCGEMNTGNRPFIDTSTSAYYIDLPYGYISLKDTAEHKPFNGNCLGIEAALWTEYVPDMKKADLMTFPRLGAVCETAWHGECSWKGFEQKLDFYYSYLDKLNWGYADIAMANPNRLRGTAQVLWFERRQLAWEGLTNIFDDKKIEKIAKANKQ